MKEVVVLSKSMPGKLAAEGVRNLDFSDIESYKEQLRGLLAEQTLKDHNESFNAMR